MADNEDQSLALELAIKSGDLDRVKHFVETEGFDLRGTTRFLDVAIQSVNLGMVRYLVDHGSLLSREALVSAIEKPQADDKDRIEMIHYLVDNGISANDKPTLEREALYAAAHVGHLSLVQYLVKKGAYTDRPSSHKVIRASIVLEAAISSGSVPVIKYLMEYLLEADPSPYIDESGSTKLASLLCRNNGLSNIKFIEFLIAKGADPNALDEREGHALLHRVIRLAFPLLHHAAVLARLHEIPSIPTTLKFVRKLIEYGASPNTIDKFGKAPWAYARRMYEEEEKSFVRCFIEHGVDITDAFRQKYPSTASILRDPTVQAKRAIAEQFKGNLLAHRAINHETHLNFEQYYEEWKKFAQKGLSEEEKRLFNTDTGKLELFKKHCKIVYLAVYTTKGSENVDKTLFFSLVCHKRVGKNAAVRGLVPDLIHVTRNHLLSPEHPEVLARHSAIMSCLNNTQPLSLDAAEDHNNSHRSNHRRP